jgi:hypothetical protein
MRCHSLQKCAARAVRCNAGSGREALHHRRSVLALLPFIAAEPAHAVTSTPEPFLKSTGARGFLAEEEEAILAFRKEAELAARTELERERNEFETAARRNQRGLYATHSSLAFPAKCLLLAAHACLHGPFMHKPRFNHSWVREVANMSCTQATRIRLPNLQLCP